MTREARRWWLLALGAVGVIGASDVLSKISSGRTVLAARDGSPAPAISVVASPARVGDVGAYLTGLGTVTALKTVTVRPRVDGQLNTVAFREGQLVREGELLAQIDPRPFQVQLEQAQGQAAKDAAALKNAQQDLQRYQVLIEQEAVPRQLLDRSARRGASDDRARAA